MIWFGNFDMRSIRANLDDAIYPDSVKEFLGNRAPKHLYLAGNLDILNTELLGFSGSRKSSVKGLEAARDCTEQAVQQNVSVVSGNGAGVDFQVHYHSLKAGGQTIFVLPEGINHFRIKTALQPVWDWERVLVISQFEPNDPWRVFRAMVRNELIIAISQVMIVIEAGENGGTLDAGKKALSSGLPLFVIQYQDMIHAPGNKQLLDAGAMKLGKKRSTNQVNMNFVFEYIKEERPLKSLHQNKTLSSFL